MSARLESLLDRERLADCEQNDRAAGIASHGIAFAVDGHSPCALADFLRGNADDPDACEWAMNAKPGEHFPAIVPCECVAV